jgi:SnoaL-like domain
VSDMEATVAALAARVKELEDRLAIYELMATYGPAVDGAARDVAAGLWTEDGSYDSGVGVFEGSAGVGEMVTGDMHQGIIKGGSAHLISLPHLEVDGDRAVATCYSQLLRYDSQNAVFRIWRATANRWELVRTEGGWRVQRRINKLLDGSEEARALLRHGVDPSVAD